MLGLGSLESLLNLGRDQQRLGADESRQLCADLLQSAAISFPLFKEKSGYFGIGFEVGFGVVLDFQVHHFLDEFDQLFCIHIRSDHGLQRLRRRVRPAMNWLAHAKP